MTTSREDIYRTFVAIELPRELRARIIEHTTELRRAFPDVRASWVREQNLHLTLKFLGDVSIPDIPKLSAAVDAATRSIKSFELIVSGCGAFPTHGQPKVLWVGTQAAGLLDLRSSLERECERLGFAREERSFHPHLTIARLRSTNGARSLARLHIERGFDSYPVKVTEASVIRSELLSEGSRYTTLDRHRLVTS